MFPNHEDPVVQKNIERESDHGTDKRVFPFDTGQSQGIIYGRRNIKNEPKNDGGLDRMFGEAQHLLPDEWLLDLRKCLAR
jgi:hypothetical protein